MSDVLEPSVSKPQLKEELAPCPNKCGKLILIENPVVVVPTQDILELDGVQEAINETNILWFIKIDVICPKCGYHYSRESRGNP